MAERPRVALFCEDRGHELFVRALVGRIAQQERVSPVVQTATSRGGRGRALSEFQAWQDSFVKVARSGVPDLLVLVIDGNCEGWHRASQKLTEAIDDSVIPSHVVGCPDPHIERWYVADPEAFRHVVGVQPQADPAKCDRAIYKRLVDEALEEAEVPSLAGSADLAPDLVRQMSLFRANKNQPALGHFIDGLTTAIRQLAAG